MSTDRSAPLDNNHVNNNKYFNNLSNSGISFLTLDNIESESAYLLTIDSIVPEVVQKASTQYKYYSIISR